MISKVILDLDVYQVAFNFTELSKSKTFLIGYVEIVPQSGIDGPTMRSIEAGTLFRDLSDLCTYLEEHTAALVQERKESYVFLPEALNFQLQALTGDVKSENEGAFTLQFMVNIGRNPQIKKSVYIGVKTLISVKAVKDFITSMRTLISNIERNQQ